MYYGDSTITGSTANASGVWDADYMGVWHFKETVGGSGAIKDSTSNAENGTNVNSPTLGAAGQMGSAITFAGTTDYVSLGNNALSGGYTKNGPRRWYRDLRWK